MTAANGLARAHVTLLAACLVLQVSVSGEPVSGNLRSCISGETCVIANILGTGLSNGDRIVLLAECGTGAAIAGMPGDFGVTLPASNGGIFFQWAGDIKPDGGEYRMCWCSIGADCSSIPRFGTDIGALTVTGPKSGVAETCVSGRHCVIDNIDGVYLQDGDSVMVLNTCEEGIPIRGFPNEAKTTTGALQGTEHSWGEMKIDALGGDYVLCWCAKAATCVQALDHVKQLGTIQVIGPKGGFMKACSSFEACTWSGFTGTGLADGDRIMLLLECGEGPVVPGFPNADIAVASGGGSTYSFAGTNNLITAGGAEYAMCWCQADSEHVCAGPANFLTRAGTLIVSGAASDHDYSCVRGSRCEVTDFRGVGLLDGDKIKVLLECGTGAAPSGWPNGGVAVASGGGTEFTTWRSGALNAQHGSYRICWCKNGWSCPNGAAAGFKMDAGLFRVVGITPNQIRSCHVQAPCQIEDMDGSNLRQGDLMKIMTKCGLGGVEVPGFPNNATSLPASDTGRLYSWGSLNTVQALVGSYKMCWCPSGHVEGCETPENFFSEAGTLVLRGPTTMGFNATCVAKQIPTCIVGPFREGVGLSYGTDRIVLVRSNETCGIHEPDPVVGGGLPGKQVGSNKMFTFLPEDLPYGGSWKMCYCASFDSGFDQDADDCSSKEDFSATAGVLSVEGAYPGQTINCTRNQACTFDLDGYGLNLNIHKLAVRDDSYSCGADVSTDGATRRRRDFTANPYLPIESAAENALTFTVNPVQTLDAFTICLCVPAPAAGPCSDNNLKTYHQRVGYLDIRGATAQQIFSCGRGGVCTLEIKGRGLSVRDRVKIVNSTTLCTGPAHTTGFFKSLLPADPAPATSSTLARFSLGQVTAGGIFKVCYCADLEGCNAETMYTHEAGSLEVLDPLSNLEFLSASTTSLAVTVSSRLESGDSLIRCAISEFEPPYMPNGADIKNGLEPGGLGHGEALEPTKAGDNVVEIFFKTFVKSTQQYRVWCVETSAQSFILPPSPGGALVVTPSGITSPSVRVFPGFLWPKALFYVELFNVYAGSITQARRLAETEVRVQTGSSPAMCNDLKYEEAISMRVVDSGKAGEYNAKIFSVEPLEASPFRLYLCFFSSPRATGIALSGDDRLDVQTKNPSFTIQRLDGLILKRLYRGVLIKVIIDNGASVAGLLHWTTEADFESNGCNGVSRAPPKAKNVKSGQTAYFRMEDAVGTYVLCYLGVEAEGSSSAPFNSLGTVELTDVISSVAPAVSPTSTRNTVRLLLEVRMPGTVTCIARATEGNVVTSDFSAGVIFAGRGALLVEPAPPGVDPEFPREFNLEIPLVEYQRDGLPLRVWCLHSTAESAVFPATTTGVEVTLQVEEPFIMPDPAFIWHGSQFRLSLFNTPDIDTKLLGMHEPALPSGWKSEVVQNGDVKQIRYISASKSSDEHPSYTSWLEGKEQVSLCQGGNASAALAVTEDSNTRTDTWFIADARKPFACFWASPGSYPHLVGKVEIRAQPPERLLEVVGQVRNHVYRGVDLNIRLRHGSATGGRLLILTKALYDSYGGACQAPSETRRLKQGDQEEGDDEEESAFKASAFAPWPHARNLQEVDDSGSTGSTNCTNSARRTSDLKLVTAEEVFPASVWGFPGAPGMNCTRDFGLYWNPSLEQSSILADQENKRYIFVTRNSSVLLHFVQKIRKLTPDGQLPTAASAVVYKDWITLAESTAEQWIINVQDCVGRLLLDPADPMYEEGAENLPLSQYLEAKLDLQGFDFLAMAYLPESPTVIEKQVVCDIFQPAAPPPKRQEQILDIDKPGLGRTVVAGQVFVPSMLNGTGSFLHSNPLDQYIVCYAGDEQDETPFFNEIGPTFQSMDVLSELLSAQDMVSTTVHGYLNVTSELPGRVRCTAYLDSVNPPEKPSDVFKPDTGSDSYLGDSELVQYDMPGTSQVITLRLDQLKVKFMAPYQPWGGAPPSMWVWCAHDGSTVLYPSAENAAIFNIQARKPPIFLYKQFNQSVKSIALTLQLEFTPVVVEFTEPEFPQNIYDQVAFQSRPAMPGGITLDPDTGAISGIPAQAGTFQRAIIAVSKNPPRSSVSFDMTINVQDVLGLRFTSASADSMLLSIAPRSTNIFQAQKVFLLTKKRTQPFTQRPEEFFCVTALKNIEYQNGSFESYCSVEDGACCCASYIMTHMPVQDLRLKTKDCGFEATGRYHTSGLVEGLLKTTDSIAKPARLRSSIKVDSTMPPEVTAEEKKPVSFDLVILMEFSEYQSAKDRFEQELMSELSLAVSIPKELVSITEVKEGKGGVVFGISFYVEPRCLQDLGAEVEMLSFGIDTKEGCNLVAPVEYMSELKTQLSTPGSALFYQPGLELLQKVSPDKSFSFDEQHFCNREPLWEYAAVSSSPETCPFDMVKLSGFVLIGGTFGLTFVLGVVSKISSECGICSTLTKIRLLDIMTPLTGIFTTLYDYAWLLFLRFNAQHPLHDTFFWGCLCILFLCFVINAAALRITITTYIVDTPWWRKNRRRLRLVLFLSILSPRFFRITRSTIGTIDRTHIHFGTPSKMAVVFSNLGLTTLLQDIPLLLVQLYVWLIWRNLAPKVSLLCFILGVQNLLTTALHHVFSRSQRAAYERVVKLLGVRRLTAGFFDVSAGVGTQAGKGLMDGMKTSTGKAQLQDENNDAFHADDVLDPTKLDPIQAAMYVAQMYDKEAIEDGAEDDAEESSDSDESDEEGEEDGEEKRKKDKKDQKKKEETKAIKNDNPVVEKTLYPKGVYEKMRRFYAMHDPTKLNSIGKGNVEVDEAVLDAELKAKFGVGLDSLN